jgi:hypothetical protein
MARNICNSILLALCGIFFVFPEFSSALVSSESESDSDAPLTEAYEFIRLLPAGRYEAETDAETESDDSSGGKRAPDTSGQWGAIDAETLKLVDEVTGRSETLKRLPSVDLSKLIGKTLITDRVEEISDQGPLSFRSVKLKADGRFVATDFIDGHKITGKYERGVRAIYDRLQDDGDLEHLLMDAIAFNFAGKRVVMTVASSDDGDLILEDPMAYGNYPKYHQ